MDIKQHDEVPYRQKEVAVIGAGPAGLAAAFTLVKKGWHPTVFEADTHVGGMSRSIKIWERRVDLGPHRFFTKSTKVINLWREILSHEVVKVKRKTRIYFDGNFINYPLGLSNTCQNIGLIESVSCVLSYLSRRKFVDENRENESLENWLISRFGNRLYEYFFKSYNTKLWGVGCDKIEADFASQRIRGLSLPQAIKSAIGLKNGAKRTLADSFEYPTEGAGMLYERLAERINDEGGSIELGEGVRSLRKLPNARGVELTTFSNKSIKFDHVVSTMPLSKLASSFDHVPCEVSSAASQLKYRNSVLVYLKVRKDNIFEDQWIYVHNSDLKLGRVTNFRNWNSSKYKNGDGTILCCEYWCSFEDEFWNYDDTTMIALAADEMEKTGLITQSLITDGHVERIPRSYPMYSLGYKDNLSIIFNWVNSIEGLTAIGRSGAHAYNNQDHSILMGILAAENISDNCKHEIRGINANEEYQES